MGTLEAFLSAMDGMEEPRGLLNRILVFLGFRPLRPYEYKYLMIGATNMMDRLDPALLRAGRFGRKIHVTYPKTDGRQRTYEGYLAKVRNDLSEANVAWAARNHEKGTGAEIKDIVNEALLITFRDDRGDPGVVRFDDLMRAMMWVSIGESEGQFERKEARWAIAVHEAGHAVAFHVLCHDSQRIWFATVERHGDTGGMVYPTAVHEDWLQTREEMLAEVQVSLASRVAEELILGTTTNGHGGDGANVTKMAEKMVQNGYIRTQIGRYEVPEVASELRVLIEEVLAEALAACRVMIAANLPKVEEVAKLLYERGTVPGDAIHALMDVA